MSTVVLMTNKDLRNMDAKGIEVRRDGRSPYFQLRFSREKVESTQILAVRDNLSAAKTEFARLAVLYSKGGTDERHLPTVGAYLNRWWEKIVARGEKRATRSGDICYMKRVVAEFGTMRPHEVTLPVFKAWIERQFTETIPSRKKVAQGEPAPEGRQRSRTDVKNIARWLKARMEEMMDDGVLIDPDTGLPAKINPLRRFNIKKVKGGAITHKTGVLDVEQFSRLLADGFIDPRDMLFVLTMIQTTMRLGELLSVRWDQLDLENQKILVVGTGDGKAVRQTKNNDAQPVTYLDWIQHAVAVHVPKDASDPLHVFAHLRKAKPANRNSGIRQMVERACKRAGVPYVNPHMLGRNGGAAWLAANGAVVADLMAQGQWKDAKTAMEYVRKAQLKKAGVPQVVTDTFKPLEAVVKLRLVKSAGGVA